MEVFGSFPNTAADKSRRSNRGGAETDAMDLLVNYYRTLSGEHPDWDDYRRAMTEDQRCIVKFEIEAAGPDIQG